MITETIFEAVLDTLKLLPFLYLTYLAMEYLEERAEEKMIRTLWKYEKAGPAIGAALGIVPQCGFSASAASLFSGGLITGGTLLAVFLSTSDEMLPIMLSQAVAPMTIAKILLTKFLFALVFGFALDFFRGLIKRKPNFKHIHDMCEREDCHCEEGNIFKSALIHTLHVILFIFVITLAFAFLVEMLGEDKLAGFISQSPQMGAFLCGIIGLIPNCAASVMITELYLRGIISAGQMIAGLMVGAGVGLLVLFRTNENMRENIRLLVCLYGCGVLAGLLTDAIGLTF